MMYNFICKDCGEKILLLDTENYGTDQSLCDRCLSDKLNAEINEMYIIDLEKE